jgi:hypothetical protein
MRANWYFIRTFDKSPKKRTTHYTYSALNNVSNLLKRLFIILLFLLGTAISTEYCAQTGGKKREKRIKVKRRGDHILTQYKSHGHADEFARGSSGRRGRLSRLFRKDRPAWVYKSSGSKKSAWRANQFLLTRSRTKGKIENAEFLDRQNSTRSKARNHGNRSFRFRKYNHR